MFLRWFSRRLHSKKLCNTRISPCVTCPLQFGCLFWSLWNSFFSLVSSACVVKCKTRLFCWDSYRTRVNSTSFSNTATYTSDSADHRERYEIDQGFSLNNSLQHFESFGEGHIFSTVHSIPSRSVRVFAEVGRLCGGRRQRLCVAGQWSIQISWRSHDGAICDRLPFPQHSATMVGVSRSCIEIHFRWRRKGSFRDPNLVATSRYEA